MKIAACFVILLGVPVSCAWAAEQADEPLTLEQIVVSGDEDPDIGVATTATSGNIDVKTVGARPTQRTADVLEAIPGLIITAHMGGGKANQYYLRGWDLDHGTDFAFYVNGVPINLPTNAHGQGYSDLNWLIPELISSIAYQKGPYFANQGDFGNAGAAFIDYSTDLPETLSKIEAGTLGYFRGLLMGSPKVGNGHLTYALETSHHDGAWSHPENYNRFNGYLGYAAGDAKSGYSLAAMAYDSSWVGNDQVPQRAIDDGLINRYGSLDLSDGGNTHRYSLSGEWHRSDDASSSKVTAYLVQYNLNLFSDFTYYLNDPVNGDQFNQRESRIYAGFRADHTLYGTLLGRATENTFGLQFRQDWISPDLVHTHQRALVGYLKADEVSESNLAPYIQNKTQWMSGFRTVAGLRGDIFRFSDASSDTANSGETDAGIFTPKLSLIFGPWNKTELYLSGGLGFRTNDARGIFTSVAPDGTPSRQLPPIVRSRGAEAGVRTAALAPWTSSLAFWVLWNDSDTFFDGDVGSIVDSDRPGRRMGIEWNNLCDATSWLRIDADLAVSQARFTDGLSAGPYIPDSASSVVSAGLTLHDVPGLPAFTSSLRLRYFGPRPLIEDDSEKSAPAADLTFEAGYALNPTWSVGIEVLNVLNNRYNDAEYYYTTRLEGEPAAGIADHNVHPAEPASIRGGVTARI